MSLYLPNKIRNIRDAPTLSRESKEAIKDPAPPLGLSRTTQDDQQIHLGSSYLDQSLLYARLNLSGNTLDLIQVAPHGDRGVGLG